MEVSGASLCGKCYAAPVGIGNADAPACRGGSSAPAQAAREVEYFTLPTARSVVNRHRRRGGLVAGLFQ